MRTYPRSTPMTCEKIGSHAQGPVNAYFEALLETGVDEMAWDDVGDDKVSRKVAPKPLGFLLVCSTEG